MVINMCEYNNVPKIRFKGFTDVWEQRKFGTLCSIVTKQTGFDYTSTIKKSLLTTSSSDTIPYLQTKNFCGINIDYNTDYFIPKSIAKDFPKINLNEKCLLFSIVGASVGNIGFFPGKIHCFLSGAICVSKFLNPNDAEYLYHFMCSNSGQNQIQTCTKGGAQATVTIEDIRNFNVDLSSNEETIKIGKFLSSIDNLITLHQRKCDTLVNAKKSLLEKMFPKNSSNIPEIRFKEFTDVWEQRKFGDYGTVSMCKRIFKNETSDSGDIPFYKIGTFGGKADAFISNEKYEYYKSKFSYPNKGDILLSASGTIGRIVEYTGEKAYFQDSNIVWLNHNEDIKNVFLKVLYPTVKWDGIEGSTIKRLYNSNFLNTCINIPNTLEQEKIGELFTNLDNLITLHQRKLEKLKNIKKSMLDKMFV